MTRFLILPTRCGECIFFSDDFHECCANVQKVKRLSEDIPCREISRVKNMVKGKNDSRKEKESYSTGIAGKDKCESNH